MRASEPFDSVRPTPQPRWRQAPILFAAAALLVAGQAHAFERERPAPTAEPCPSKGPGFFRVPGSRSCTRLSGRVAAGADLTAGSPGPRAAPVAAGRLAIDNRTDSDLGEVRTYLRLGNGRR